ncbi:WAS/WASL-interacting protein family member 3-like [Dipodomys merriami]|uniref:WAS/WASL-interacting protein family member 3-like n=1 Tax=Dipodomys merriami TaxID=94247 RepID=UPI003855C57B
MVVAVVVVVAAARWWRRHGGGGGTVVVAARWWWWWRWRAALRSTRPGPRSAPSGPGPDSSAWVFGFVLLHLVSTQEPQAPATPRGPRPQPRPHPEAPPRSPGHTPRTHRPVHILSVSALRRRLRGSSDAQTRTTDVKGCLRCGLDQGGSSGGVGGGTNSSQPGGAAPPCPAQPPRSAEGRRCAETGRQEREPGPVRGRCGRAGRGPSGLSSSQLPLPRQVVARIDTLTSDLRLEDEGTGSSPTGSLDSGASAEKTREPDFPRPGTAAAAPARPRAILTVPRRRSPPPPPPPPPPRCR